MKTINLTDDQFETLFEFVNQKVESIVDADGELSIRVYDETLKKNVKVLDKSLR